MGVCFPQNNAKCRIMNGSARASAKTDAFNSRLSILILRAFTGKVVARRATI